MGSLTCSVGQPDTELPVHMPVQRERETERKLCFKKLAPTVRRAGKAIGQAHRLETQAHINAQGMGHSCLSRKLQVFAPKPEAQWMGRLSRIISTT